jgi:hypothetical protein
MLRFNFKIDLQKKKKKKKKIIELLHLHQVTLTKIIRNEEKSLPSSNLKPYY